MNTDFTLIDPDHDHPGCPGPATASRAPLWRIGWRVVAVAACLGIVVLTGCSVALGSDTIDEASDIDLGQCLQIGAEVDSDGKVDAAKAECGAEGLTFYAASKVPADGECASDNTATLSFGSGSEKLCMTPNFVDGKCYQIPLNGGELVDYKQLACEATAADNTVLAQTVTRSDASVTCSDEQTKWEYSEPKSIGYCLREVV
ncbi:pyridine nucleotide-disulfide oxidoreductase [Gordonia sp. NPDC003425]